MPRGIVVFGANGSGKSTLGRELAHILQYRYMDIEDYYFVKSEIPYSVARSREECLSLMLDDIEKHHSFVISTVIGDFGEEIKAMYECAVFMSAPLEIRLERIKQRSYKQHGERVCDGGDMFDQEKRFYDFVASRSLSEVEDWAKTLLCPIIRVDGTKPVHENAQWIASQYQELHTLK
jgi:shikimate kinase